MHTLDNTDWEAIRSHWDAWWQQKSGKPIVALSIAPTDNRAYRYFTAMYPETMTIQEILAIEDDHLRKTLFFGDAFPHFWPNFGPGVLCACIGGKGLVSEDTVWFEPGKFSGIEPENWEIQFDPASPWARRITEIYHAARDFWQDRVALGMTDIGGVSDIAFALRGGMEFLLDLADNPQMVAQVLQKIHRAWYQAYHHWRLAAGEKGFTDFCRIYSDSPYHMFQSDVSSMLSPDCFNSVILPELEANFKRTPGSFYHLDGPGELVHLDSLLNSPTLAGIQWIPGDGQKPLEEWGELLNKIADSGKKLQLIGPVPNVLKALQSVSNQSACIVVGFGTREDMELCENYQDFIK